jgi:hypothetical protein
MAHQETEAMVAQLFAHPTRQVTPTARRGRINTDLKLVTWFWDQERLLPTLFRQKAPVVDREATEAAYSIKVMQGIGGPPRP